MIGNEICTGQLGLCCVINRKLCKMGMITIIIEYYHRIREHTNPFSFCVLITGNFLFLGICLCQIMLACELASE